NCFSKLGKCKKILVVHGSIMKDSGKPKIKKFILNKFILPITYRRANVIITVSKKMRDELISIGIRPSKIQAIPNFFDLEKIALLSDKSLEVYQDLFSQKKVVLHVGRLSLQKNQNYLLELAAF